MYKEEATRYFQMLVAAMNVASKEEQYTCLPSVLTLSLAQVRDAFHRPTAVDIAETELAKACKVTETRLRVCCSGFLEIGALRTGRSRSPGRGDSKLKAYDEDMALVRFSHRSAREFLIEHTDFGALYKQAKNTRCWEPNLALARAYIRRLEVLPWIDRLERKFPLFEYYHALQHLREFEKHSGRSCEDTLTYLGSVGSGIADKLRLQGPLAQPLTWTTFAGIQSFGRYVGPAIDVHGVGALWGLKNTVRRCLEETAARPTYLLNCATSRLVSPPGSKHLKEAFFYHQGWKFSSFGICRMLLEAGR